MNIRALFKKKTKTKTRCDRSYDAGYVDGSTNERERIIKMMDTLIESNDNMPFSSLLVQARNTLLRHNPN